MSNIPSPISCHKNYVGEGQAASCLDTQQTSNKHRLSNIELLRVVSMFLVLLIHYVPIREIPTTETLHTSPFETLFNLELRSLSFVCVNCFVLISGYFGIKWKLRSFINLTFQILFWTIACYCIGLLIFPSISILDALKHDLTRWFVEAYIGLYLLAPIMNAFIEKVNVKELGFVLLFFYVFSCLYGYLFKAPDFNEGMSVISLCGLYLIGAWLRRNKGQWLSRIKPGTWLMLYLGTGFVMVAIAAVALLLNVKSSPYGYLNPLIIAESVFLFMFFQKIKIPQLKWIDWIAASAFAVYLIHTSKGINPLYNQTLRHIEAEFNYPFLMGLLFLILVFAICVLSDKARILIYKWIIPRLHC